MLVLGPFTRQVVRPTRAACSLILSSAVLSTRIFPVVSRHVGENSSWTLIPSPGIFRQAFVSFVGPTLLTNFREGALTARCANKGGATTS